MGRVLNAVLPEDRYDVGTVVGADGALACVADVRLDNRHDLLRSLNLSDTVGSRLSDAALMMRCFERWSEAALECFIGDFALALWDRRTERLLLARDFAGQRPLFFAEGNGTLAVASMAGGLHALSTVSCRVNEERMLQTMLGLPHHGRGSFFAGIERVEPGEALTFNRGPRFSRVFWSPPSEEICLHSTSDYAEALNEKLQTAVTARLRGNRNRVATHLSAGLDSSAVTTAAALATDMPLLAMTSRPSGVLPPLPAGRFGDEGAIARQTAAMYPTIEQRMISVGTNLGLMDLGRHLRLFERPDLNLPNLVWLNRINSEAQAENIEILLTGAMGNATISYDGSDLLGRLISKGRLIKWGVEFGTAYSAGVDFTALLRMSIPPAARFATLRVRDKLAIGSRHILRDAIINPERWDRATALIRANERNLSSAKSSIAHRYHMLRKVDPGTYNKGVLLGWNLDLRDPTADRRVVDFCFRVPLDQYFRKGISRSLIRSALKGRVPEGVRCNQQRGLQSPAWFELLTNDRPVCQDIFNRIRRSEIASKILDIPAMQRRLDDWPAPQLSFGPMHYRTGVLRGLVAGEFMQMFGGA